MSEVFVSTDARRAYLRGVIGSTVGTYPRGTGSNPVEGNGHFFPSYRQLYRSSFSDTRTHTHTHARTHAHTHTHTHTHTLSLSQCLHKTIHFSIVQLTLIKSSLPVTVQHNNNKNSTPTLSSTFIHSLVVQDWCVVCGRCHSEHQWSQSERFQPPSHCVSTPKCR